MREMFSRTLNDFKAASIKGKALAGLCAAGVLLLSLYIIGFMDQSEYSMVNADYHMSFSPGSCIWTAVYGLAHGASSPIRAAIILLLLAVLAVLAYARLTERGPAGRFNYNVSREQTHGSAYLMTKAEADKKLKNLPVEKTTENILGLSGDGMNVYSDDPVDPRDRTNGFLALIAASGRRKTRGFVIPLIYQILKRGESAIVTDPKGELYNLTAGLARKMGYTVRMVNTKQTHCSDGFEPLSVLDLDVEGRNPLGDPVEIVQKMVDTIIKNTMSRNGKSDDFFVNSEKMLMTTAFLYVKYKEEVNTYRDGDTVEKRYRKSLAKVYEFLMQPTAQICTDLSNLPPAHPARALADDFVSGTDVIKESARKGCTNILKEMEAPSTKNMFSHDDIDLSLPGRERCLYYIVTPALHSEKNWMAGLFYSLSFLTLVEGVAENSPGEKLPVPVNFILEEFPSTAYIPDFNKILNTVRSNDIRITVIAQNIAQMKDMFPGVEYQTIMEAFDTIIMGGCNAAGENGDTADFFSRMSGVCTEDMTSVNRSLTQGFMQMGMPTSEGLSTGRRPVMTPDEVRAVPRDEQVLFMACCNRPLIVKKFDRTMHPLDAEAEKYKGERANEHTPLYAEQQADYGKAPKMSGKPGRQNAGLLKPYAGSSSPVPENRNDIEAGMGGQLFPDQPPAPTQGGGTSPKGRTGQSRGRQGDGQATPDKPARASRQSSASGYARQHIEAPTGAAPVMKAPQKAAGSQYRTYSSQGAPVGTSRAQQSVKGQNACTSRVQQPERSQTTPARASQVQPADTNRNAPTNEAGNFPAGTSVAPPEERAARPGMPYKPQSVVFEKRKQAGRDADGKRVSSASAQNF